MSKEEKWLTKSSVDTADLIGKVMELNTVASNDPHYKLSRFKGRIEVHHHEQDNKNFRIRLVPGPLDFGDSEYFLDQVEAMHIAPHPNPSKADYLCEVQYASASVVPPAKD
jgi:hypothetical protein